MSAEGGRRAFGDSFELGVGHGLNTALGQSGISQLSAQIPSITALVGKIRFVKEG